MRGREETCESLPMMKKPDRKGGSDIESRKSNVEAESLQE